VNDNAKQWCDAIRDSSLTPDLTPTQRHVAQNLGNYFKAYGRAFPGAAKQARETGYHVTTIRRACNELTRKQYLVLIEHGGSKRGEKRIADQYLPSLPEQVIERLTGGRAHSVRSALGAENAPTDSRALADPLQSAAPINNESEKNHGKRFSNCTHGYVFDIHGESTCSHRCVRQPENTQ
jgi:hypothetical protein